MLSEQSQRLVQREQLLVVVDPQVAGFSQREMHSAAPALLRELRFGVIDERVSHGQGRRAEEMPIVGPAFLIAQFQERFIDERGRLQRVARTDTASFAPADAAQVLIKEG
jgi:hypothetical protein